MPAIKVALSIWMFCLPLLHSKRRSVTVSSYSTGAHVLYESMGFSESDLLGPWINEG